MSAVLTSPGALPRPDSLAGSKSIAQSVGLIRASSGRIPGPPPGVGGARRSTGLVVVLGLHVLLGWALASGLAREAVNIVKKPIQMVIVPEEIAPPPPPPPPKVQKVAEAPKVHAPPPAYVPPPEVVPVAPPAPVIQAVQAEPPREPVRIEPPPPPAPPAPPPAPPVPAVIKQEISVACPGYKTALPDVLADAFDRVGISGTVKVLLKIKIKGNQVTDVVPLSGPKEYYKYLPASIKRTMRRAAGGDGEVQATLDVVFRKRPANPS